MASIHPLAAILSDLGGDAIEVVTLLPAGADPHVFEAKPSQARAIDRADLVVSVGGGLDPYVAPLVEAANPGVVQVRALDSVPAAELITGGDHGHNHCHHHDHGHCHHDDHSHGHHQDDDRASDVGGDHDDPPPTGHDAAEGADPHIWLDPELVRQYLVPALVETLADIDPAGAEQYLANGEALAAELALLHEWVQGQLSPFAAKGLITIHPAWAYLGRRYNLDTWSLQAHAGTEPSARHLGQLLEIAAERGIKALFREPQMTDTGLTVFVSSMGGQVMVLDPIGDPNRSGYATYPELMRTNIASIVRGLGLE